MNSRILQRNNRISTALDLLLLLPILLFICFYGLSTPSFHPGDEATHVRVTQEMLHGGSWWTPHAFDRDYFNKPPLKMWLSLAATALQGESGFSYRSLDALSGVLTALLLYFFARTVFASRLAGLFSALVLMGCKACLFFHGARSANQDSMLVLFSTAALLVGWRFLHLARPALLPAVLGGALIGCAVLVKNVVGYLPLFVLGGFLVATGNIWEVLRTRWLGIIVTVALAFVLPALYLVPHCLRDNLVCLVMLDQEVVERVSVGYHHTDDFWFYFYRLFKGRMTIPPEMLLPSLAFGLFRGFFKRDERYVFLLSWFVLPFLLFTFIPSRNDWYISPALPGGALLCGAVLAESVSWGTRAISTWWRGESRLSIFVPVVIVFWGAALFGLGWHYKMVLRKVIFPREERIYIDRFLDTAEKKLLVSYGDFVLGRNEMVYRDMHPRRATVADAHALAELLQKQEVGYLLAPLYQLPEFVHLAPFSGYELLEPVHKRGRWAVMLGYGGAHGPFRPVRRLIRFGEESDGLLFGWSDRQSFNSLPVRLMSEERAGLLFEVDPVIHETGYRVKINFAPLKAASNFMLGILLNSREITALTPENNHLETYEFNIPGGELALGRNVLVFEKRGEAETLLFNWLSLALAQKGEEEHKSERR
jgi:hypothetical protein